MPRVEVGDSRAVYTYVPFSKPVHIKAKSKQSFCVHTDKKTGMCVRDREWECCEHTDKKTGVRVPRRYWTCVCVFFLYVWMCVVCVCCEHTDKKTCVCVCVCVHNRACGATKDQLRWR